MKLLYCTCNIVHNFLGQMSYTILHIILMNHSTYMVCTYHNFSLCINKMYTWPAFNRFSVYLIDYVIDLVII